MSTETRSKGGRTRNTGRRAALAGAVFGSAVGAALLPAGTAHASIVGVGNATFGNTCVIQGDAQATGATVAGSGAGSGNYLGLPLNLTRNQCGNSGLVCYALFMARN